MDQNSSSDYYMVASACFVNTTIWSNVTGVAILHYSNSKGKAKDLFPDGPDDYYDKYFSMNQARSIRWNVSVGAERGRVIDEVSNSYSEWGIFQVVDHDVPKELVDSMTRLSRDFFALPAEEKLKYDMRGGKRGGFVVSIHLQGEIILDWRDICTYFCYPLRQRNYNRWLVEPDGWREIVEKYSEALKGVACNMLAIVSEALGLELDAVTKACMEMDQKVVIHFYPKCPQPDRTRHTDPGTITLLLQDQVGGLQATKDDGKNWITIEPIQGAFVVNLGDHMHYLSNDTRH